MRPSGIRGVRARRRAIRALPQALKDEAAATLEDTTAAVHAAGQANYDTMIVSRSGTGRRLYRRSVNRKALAGRVGYLSKKSQARAFYIRFLHDGTVHIAAKPFHDMAVESESGNYQDQMRAALARALRGLR